MIHWDTNAGAVSGERASSLGSRRYRLQVQPSHASLPKSTAAALGEYQQRRVAGATPVDDDRQPELWRIQQKIAD